MTKEEFILNIQAMSFSRLVDYIYWDNHGGDNMDIEPSDWTMADVIEVITGDDWEEFPENYARFLEEA